MAEPTELEELKANIEDGDSWLEALEKVDLDKMREEGNAAEAVRVCVVLAFIADLELAANIG